MKKKIIKRFGSKIKDVKERARNTQVADFIDENQYELRKLYEASINKYYNDVNYLIIAFLVYKAICEQI